ncbi:MAG: hypothetical protein AAFZ15_07795 [Bacteroidota bacterium]
MKSSKEKHQLILKSQCFYVGEFEVPDFELGIGEMVRFWVQIVPNSASDTGGHWGIDKMKATLANLNFRKKPIKICSNKLKRTIFDYLKPKTVGGYLKNKFSLPEEAIQKLVSQFGIKPEYKIKNLGTGHQKIFSILCEFQRNEIVAFDYYGLDPGTEGQLTEFVKSELRKGKSAISFDNLSFQPENPDAEMIKNLEILRISHRPY